MIAARWGRLWGYALLLALVNAASAEAEPLRLLVLGDSLSAGWGLAVGQSFPEQLEKALRAEGRDVRVINAGVSGDTSAGGLARLDWVLAERPQAAIVELGANDGLRALDPEKTYVNLSAILARFEKTGMPVLLAGMLAPPNLGREYGRQFARVYQRLAQENKVIFDPFFLEGVAGRPELNLQDGLHPNAEGVAVIVRRLLPQVRRLVERGR